MSPQKKSRKLAAKLTSSSAASLAQICRSQENKQDSTGNIQACGGIGSPPHIPFILGCVINNIEDLISSGADHV